MTTTLELRHPLLRALVHDALLASRTQLKASIAGVLVVAVVCIVVLVTTGRTAATEHDIVASIEGLGARLVVVTDVSGDAGIHSDSVLATERVGGVDWAFGLGTATEAANVSLPNQRGVAMRPLVGSLPNDVVIEHGRTPIARYEAIVGERAQSSLGLVDVVGGVHDRHKTVGTVGLMSASGPLDFLNDAVLHRPDSDADEDVRYIYLAVDMGADAEEVAHDVRSVLHVRAADDVDVAVSDGVIALRDVVSGHLGASARQLMLMVLGTGLLLVVLTTYAAVSARRRDFGRRRALGASRSALVALVVIQTGFAACVGAVLGTAIGVIAVRLSTGITPAGTFVAGVAILAIAMALLAAVVPALIGSMRDPVRVLRVP